MLTGVMLILESFHETGLGQSHTLGAPQANLMPTGVEQPVSRLVVSAILTSESLAIVSDHDAH